MCEVKGHRVLHIILTLVCCDGLHLFVTGVGRESLKLSDNQLLSSMSFLDLKTIFVLLHPPDLLQLLADVLITAGDRLVLVVEHLVHIQLVLYFSVFWRKI